MAEISLLRIDDRLIHGQVMTGWVKHINATRIIIVDDDLVKDEFMISVLEMAVPNSMQLNIYDPQQAIAKLEALVADGTTDKIIVLVKSPLPVLTMLQGGAKFKMLTVGGMGINEHRSILHRNIAASSAERDAFKQIEQLQLPVRIQVLPSDTPIELKQYL